MLLILAAKTLTAPRSQARTQITLRHGAPSRDQPRAFLYRHMPSANEFKALTAVASGGFILCFVIIYSARIYIYICSWDACSAASDDDGESLPESATYLISCQLQYDPKCLGSRCGTLCNVWCAQMEFFCLGVRATRLMRQCVESIKFMGQKKCGGCYSSFFLL